METTKQCLTHLDHSNASQSVMGMCTLVAPLTDLAVLLWHRVTKSTQDYCLKNFALIAIHCCTGRKEQTGESKLHLNFPCACNYFLAQTPPFLLSHDCSCSMPSASMCTYSRLERCSLLNLVDYFHYSKKILSCLCIHGYS